MVRPRKPISELSSSRKAHLSASEIYLRQKIEEVETEQREIISNSSKKVNRSINTYIKKIKSVSSDEIDYLIPLLNELKSVDNLLNQCKHNLDTNGILNALGDGLNPVFNAYDKLQKQKISLVKELNNVIKTIKKNNSDTEENNNNSIDLSNLDDILKAIS